MDVGGITGVGGISAEVAESVEDKGMEEGNALAHLRGVLLRHRLIPVARLDSVRDAEPLADALQRAGLPLLQVDLTTSASLGAIAAIRSAFTGFVVGAGAMHLESQLEGALYAGAQFGSGPVMNPALLAAARAAGFPFLPGAMTPSEIECGIRWGCLVQCIYPAAAIGGPPMVRALAEACLETRMVWVSAGGVRMEDFQEYLAIPGVGAVAGGFVCEQALIEAGMWEDIEAQALLCRRKADAAVRARFGEEAFKTELQEESEEIFR